MSGQTVYTYVGDDPVDRNDPTGMYACGKAMSRTECTAFKRAQREAMRTYQKAISTLQKLSKSVADGKGTGRFLSETKSMADRMEAYFGKGSVTTQNISSLISRDQNILSALNSTSQTANSAEQPAGRPDARAASPVGGHGNIAVFPAFYHNDIGDESRARALGHEADHGENGFHDQKLSNGLSAYGSAAALQLALQNPTAAVQNPDNQTYVNFGSGAR